MKRTLRVLWMLLSAAAVSACSGGPSPVTPPVGNGDFYAGVPSNEESWKTALTAAMTRINRGVQLVTAAEAIDAHRRIAPSVLCPCANGQTTLASSASASPLCRMMNGYHCGLADQPARLFTATAKALKDQNWLTTPSGAAPAGHFYVRGIAFELKGPLQAADWTQQMANHPMLGRVENGTPHIAIDADEFRRVFVAGAIPFCAAPTRTSAEDALVVLLTKTLMKMVYEAEEYSQLFAFTTSQTLTCAPESEITTVPFLGAPIRACRATSGLLAAALARVGCVAAEL